MAIRKRKTDEGLDPEGSQSGLWRCIESFSCDLESTGAPVVVLRNETLEESHELVQRFRDVWFVPAGTSSWKQQEILQQRLDARASPRDGKPW